MTVGRVAKTKQGRYALFDEEGAFLFSVDGDTLAQSGLRAGTVLDGAALADLRARSDTRRAHDKALSYLALRDHAAGELYEKLCRTFDARDAAAAVADMERLGLLDDEKYARARARALAARHKSAREIRADLARRGVARETADAAVDALGCDETDACRALIEKNYLRKLAAGRRDLVAAALARRGFSYGAIRDALACFDGAEE